jgi:hypothetical protein
MKHEFPFTIKFIESEYQKLIELAYQFITCAEIVEVKKQFLI